MDWKKLLAYITGSVMVVGEKSKRNDCLRHRGVPSAANGTNPETI